MHISGVLIRPVRRSLALLTAAATAAGLATAVVAPPAGATVPTCASAGLTVTALHGPNFYIDPGESLYGAYAGYRVTNTGSARTDLWVRLAGFGGGSVSLGTGQAASQQIVSLAGGAGQSLFWYLTASGANAAAQTHDVEVWSGRPDLPTASQVCGGSGGFANVQGTIKAAANKLTSVSVGGGTPKIGGSFTITVSGETGTIGSGPAGDPQSFWMSPAAGATWPANAYRLVGTTLNLGGTTYTDVLRVANAGSSNKTYTAVYTFRAIGYTASSTGVVPVQQIASGTQIKHTDLNSVASLPAITPATNDLQLAKSASPTSLPSSGGTVTYQVTATGTSGSVIDDFADTLPVGASLVPGSATWRGSAVPDGVLTSGVLTFSGPFTMAASGNVLQYQLSLPATSGDRVNSVVGHVGSAVIDTSTSLLTDIPPTATVHVNADPVAVDDTLDATQDVVATLPVRGNDTDADGDTLTVTAVSTPAHGTTSTDGSSVTYTPAGGYNGPDQFTYTISDGQASDTATVDLTVHPQVTLAPVDDTTSAVAGVAEVVDVLGNDVGNAPLTVTTVSTPNHGSAVITHAGTRVTYTASGGYSGSDQFTYDVTDALGGTQTATVNVTVGGALQPVDDTATVGYDSTVLVDVLGNDPGGAALGSVATAPSHGTAVVESGQVRYTPDGTFAGTDTFGYLLSGSPTEGTVTVTVTPPALDAVNDTAATAHGGTAVTVDVTDNDTGDGLTITSVSTPTTHGGTTSVVGGQVVMVPADGYRGADTFTYTVTDVVGNTDTATVTVTVPNGAPTVTDPAARTIVAGGSTTFALTVTDPDPDDDPAASAGTPTGSANAASKVTATIGSHGGAPTVRVAANLTFSGTVTVPVTVSDGHGGTDSTSLHVTVRPRAPIGVIAGIVGNPAAAAAISRPRFDAAGNPVARTLSTRIDSRVTWQQSPTSSVVQYRVTVNGRTACTVAALRTLGTQSCLLTEVALDRTDTVTVMAIGQAGVRSVVDTVPVARPSGSQHLMAVVYFPVGEFSLDPTARQVLANVSAQARKYGLHSVELVGHTDSDAPGSYNLTLSRQRSRQVAQWLTDRDDRIRVGGTSGYGETRPAMANDSRRGKAANRRVEIYVGD